MQDQENLSPGKLSPRNLLEEFGAGRSRSRIHLRSLRRLEAHLTKGFILETLSRLRTNTLKTRSVQTLRLLVAIKSSPRSNTGQSRRILTRENYVNAGRRQHTVYVTNIKDSLSYKCAVRQREDAVGNHDNDELLLGLEAVGLRHECSMFDVLQ
eukprot:COSAG02_NODE_10328_length_1967_cov_1.673448_2_plen_154_part_00